MTGSCSARVDVRNMEMEPDIENMKISEYLEYKAAKERRLWDDVRSRRSPTKYNEANVDSFYQNKSKTFSYSYSHNLTPPHPYFLPVQPYPKNYFVSTIESNDVDIENITIAEYNLYVAKQGLGINLLSHSYGFTPYFFAQPPHTPNTSKKDSDFDKILDDLFRTGAENIKRMGHDIVQDSIWEQDDDSEEDQEEDGDDEDTFDMWDITVEDVERIRKFFNVPDEIVQPLIPEPIHTTPPNDDYVAPATKSILDELLEEFGDEILNVATIYEEADPTKDLKELERLLAMRPQSNFTEIQLTYTLKESIATSTHFDPKRGDGHTGLPRRIRRVKRRDSKQKQALAGGTPCLFFNSCRKAHLLEDKQIPSVELFDESIERFPNNFANQLNTNDLEFDDKSIDTPLVSPFPHSDNDSDDGEVLNELSEYDNAGTLHRERIINSFDGDDLAFQCMISFRKFTTYLALFLPMNIISCKSYNSIMVEGLEGTGKNLVAIVRDVYVFVGSFTYITDFVVLEEIGEFIMSDMVIFDEKKLGSS
ncbi:hypothetical protein Tco_0422592 [Tanacetum coccineum]